MPINQAPINFVKWFGGRRFNLLTTGRAQLSAADTDDRLTTAGRPPDDRPTTAGPPSSDHSRQPYDHHRTITVDSGVCCTTNVRPPDQHRETADRPTNDNPIRPLHYCLYDRRTITKRSRDNSRPPTIVRRPNDRR